ncbi:MAG: hypothetical protein LBT54_00825, partial [Bifidobacteriaceae bacterium]|nr:hypothetical protein [Bifidobacteriaceae bacterium]
MALIIAPEGTRPLRRVRPGQAARTDGRAGITVFGVSTARATDRPRAGSSAEPSRSRPAGAALCAAVVLTGAASTAIWAAGWEASLFVIGALLATGTAYSALWISQRRDRSNLYLALVCLAWCVCQSTGNPEILARLAPGLSWDAASRIGLVALAVVACLESLAFARLFPGSQGKWLRRPRTARGLGAREWLEVAGFALGGGGTVMGALVFDAGAPGAVGPQIAGAAVLAFALIELTAAAARAGDAVQEARAAARAQAEQEAASRRRAQLRADLIRQLSHQIHTPLAVVTGFAQLVQSEIEDLGVTAQSVADLREAAAEASRLR